MSYARFIIRCCAMLLAVTVVSPLMEAQVMYQLYKDEPIVVYDRTGKKRNTPIILRNINQEAIEYSPQNYKKGTLELPLDNEELELYFEYPVKEWNRSLDAMKNGDYKTAIDLLRPIAYPLVKYLVLAEAQFNGHEAVLAFYASLVEGGSLDEALELAPYLPLERLRDDFADLTVELARRLVETGDAIKAIRAIKLIPLASNRMHLLPVMLQFANSLREQGQYDASLILYERIRQLPNSPVERRATLWIAYVNILIDQYDKARSFVAIIGDIDKKEEDYSLRQLVLGRLKLLSNDPVDAIDVISQGVVASDVSYAWMPDLLYASGLAYEGLGNHPLFHKDENAPAQQASTQIQVKDNKLVAANIYHQLKLFYPDNTWAKDAGERMKALPQPAEIKAILPDEVIQRQREERGNNLQLEDEEWESVEPE